MGTYKYIASTTVTGASTGSITFSSIPQTYTDLVIRVIVRADTYSAGGNIIGLRAYLNGDSSTNNNTWVVIRGDGSSATSAAQTTQSNQGYYVGLSASAAATTGMFSTHELYLRNYTSNLAKYAYSFGAMEDNTSSGYPEAWINLISTNTATTSVTLQQYASGAQVIKAGSTFYLYGI